MAKCALEAWAECPPCSSLPSSGLGTAGQVSLEIMATECELVTWVPERGGKWTETITFLQGHGDVSHSVDQVNFGFLLSHSLFLEENNNKKQSGRGFSSFPIGCEIHLEHVYEQKEAGV